MRPDRRTQEECLAWALSEVIWKAGEKQKATLCLLQEDDALENTEFFRGDGVTEKVGHLIGHWCPPQRVLLFLYSCVDGPCMFLKSSAPLLLSSLFQKRLNFHTFWKNVLQVVQLPSLLVLLQSKEVEKKNQVKIKTKRIIFFYLE